MGDRLENDSESRETQADQFARAYRDAVLSGDEIAAEIAIREAMDAKLSTAQIDELIIGPAMWLVGDLWELGEISVADEHIATEISLRVLALQREAHRVNVQRGEHRVMLAAPTGELHVVALRMVSNLLNEAGYWVTMLGPDVPPQELGASARRYEPDVICITSTMSAGAHDVMRAIDAVGVTWPAAGFVVGGRAVSSQAFTRPRIEVCERVSGAVDAVDAIIKRARMN